MKDFLRFLLVIGEELADLFAYVKSDKPDPETERQLAMRIIRKAKDDEAVRTIEGP